MNRKITYALGLLFFGLSGVTSAQTWTEKTGLESNTSHHPVTWAIDGFGYSATGTNTSNLPTKDFYKYDPATDSWETLTDFPGPARSFSIGGVYNGEAYLGFGSNSTTYHDDLWKYNPTTETWTELSTCPCIGRNHPTLTINEEYGKLYVGKGNDDAGNLDDWWEYDIATDTWTQMPDFPGTERHHPFHFSIGDFSYTGLGHDMNPQMARSDWYRFNPSDNSWDQLSDAPGARIAGTQFSYNGLGYVLSGDAEHHGATFPSIFWVYEPNGDQWTELNPHPGNSIWAPGSFVIDGVVHFFGGVDYIDQTFPGEMWTTDLDDIASIDSNEDITFSVFPNPANSYLKIQASNELENSEIKIYNLDGRLLIHENYQGSIDISSIISGVYILEITNNDQTSTVKFVKE